MSISPAPPNPPVYTAHDVGDLLAAAPVLFGFRPEESFVAVATHGPRRRLGFRLRADLPEPDHLDDLAELAARHLVRQGADGAVLLAFTADRTFGEAMALAAAAALPREVELVACAWADGERYWEPLPGHPAVGVPYDASSHAEPVVAAVAAGQEIVRDRAALAARFAPCEGPLRSRMVAATGRAVTAVLAQTSAVARPGLAEDEVVDAALSVLDPLLAVGLGEGEQLNDDEAALLSVWLSAEAVRDELWSRITRESARAWLTMLADVATRVLPPFETPVLTLAGFSAWLAGDGAQAVIALERALRARPEDRVTRLLMELISHGISPDEWDGPPRR
ncbi:MAG: DUF4192 domain-containing protein [Aeromicrobium sp.]|uniref:DUF4192 domain-containing protein n=1 Tax=Aeromicrobium sp. TaxID=1871063 RepID=UPI0039E40136